MGPVQTPNHPAGLESKGTFSGAARRSLEGRCDRLQVWVPNEMVEIQRRKRVARELPGLAAANRTDWPFPFLVDALTEPGGRLIGA